MKLMQNSFPQFRKIEVELTKEQEIEKIPEGPSEYFSPLGINNILPAQLDQGLYFSLLGFGIHKVVVVCFVNLRFFQQSLTPSF